MDPDATLKKFYESIANGELEEADEAAESLMEWLLSKGGFPPFETETSCLLSNLKSYLHYRNKLEVIREKLK